MGEGLQNGKSNGHATKDSSAAKQSLIDAKGASTEAGTLQEAGGNWGACEEKVIHFTASAGIVDFAVVVRLWRLTSLWFD